MNGHEVKDAVETSAAIELFAPSMDFNLCSWEKNENEGTHGTPGLIDLITRFHLLYLYLFSIIVDRSQEGACGLTYLKTCSIKLQALPAFDK